LASDELPTDVTVTLSPVERFVSWRLEAVTEMGSPEDHEETVD
jgi:hypothetical protein